jgi:uncharacterized protein (UPF0332 family)
MKPNDFLNLAVRLSRGTTEAEYRSSVSRAYYAAFHTAMELMSEAGVMLPRSPESHQKLRFCLNECGEGPGMVAGRRLAELRKERNIADYDLADPTYAHVEEVPAQLEAARRIVQLLDTCRQEPARSRFRAAVRNYAANVLRLPVSG